ncbi:MAG: hypothetical protein IT229_10730 [Flavobacteriales bacterium]|nr:hypothetical protein [Flavobacteriales bacterium]
MHDTVLPASSRYLKIFSSSWKLEGHFGQRQRPAGFQPVPEDLSAQAGSLRDISINDNVLPASSRYRKIFSSSWKFEGHFGQRQCPTGFQPVPDDLLLKLEA